MRKKLAVAAILIVLVLAGLFWYDHAAPSTSLRVGMHVTQVNERMGGKGQGGSAYYAYDDHNEFADKYGGTGYGCVYFPEPDLLGRREAVCVFYSLDGDEVVEWKTHPLPWDTPAWLKAVLRRF